MTRRATVDVLDPASTRDDSRLSGSCFESSYIASARNQQKTPLPTIPLFSRDATADTDVTVALLHVSAAVVT
jgi:hypothetical protein